MNTNPTLIYYNDMGSGFEMGIFRGIARFVREQSPPWRLRRVGKQADIVPDPPLRGIIGFTIDPEELASLSSRDCPLVFCSNRMLGKGFPCVITDNQAIGRMAAAYFRKRFFQHFAFVGSANFPFSRGRENGFCEQLPPESLHRFISGFEKSQSLRDSNLLAFLRTLPKGTGLFACNDNLARWVCTLARQGGVQIPQDLAVLGADADEFVNYESEINLSSVDPDAERIGYRAAETIARMRNAPNAVPADFVIQVAPRQVLEAESTYPLQTGDEAVFRVTQQLRQQLEQPLDVPVLASEAGCSRRALEMRFARVTGMGIAEYLRQLRLDHAKKLLRETHLLVYEVAALCGYQSVYYFGNSFRKATGVTPRSYRLRGKMP